MRRRRKQDNSFGVVGARRELIGTLVERRKDYRAGRIDAAAFGRIHEEALEAIRSLEAADKSGELQKWIPPYEWPPAEEGGACD
ncbi:MAG: hypothetical protein IPJ58_12190 [Ardenticatenia bacterium]|nr:hypothetical protein [Ardenticatenia bacterium]